MVKTKENDSQKESRELLKEGKDKNRTSRKQRKDRD